MSAPVIELKDLGKSFRITRRKKASGVDHATYAAFLRVVKDSFARTAGASDEVEVRVVDALSGLDLDIMPGEVLGVIGRNGAGKSTLLKILARVIEPTRGRAIIRGRVVSLLELGLGFAPDLTVRENIYLYGQLAGMRRQEVREAEEAILDFSELTRHRDVPLHLCPSGSFVRLAFSAMIGIPADVILADEVLAVGDAKFRRRCEERIRNVGVSGEAVLFVSHDMEAIRRCCSRVVWIDGGRIRMLGNADDVTRAYAEEILGRSENREGSAILDLRLTSDSGASVGAFVMNAPGCLETIFRVEAGSFGRLTYELYQNKQMVFRSISPWTARADGDQPFRAALDVPAHFLNDRRYRLRAALATSRDRGAEPVLRDTVELGVDVMNSDNADSVWADWDWARKGLLSPRLTWSHAIREDSHAADQL